MSCMHSEIHLDPPALNRDCIQAHSPYLLVFDSRKFLYSCHQNENRLQFCIRSDLYYLYITLYITRGRAGALKSECSITFTARNLLCFSIGLSVAWTLYNWTELSIFGIELLSCAKRLLIKRARIYQVPSINAATVSSVWGTGITIKCPVKLMTYNFRPLYAESHIVAVFVPNLHKFDATRQSIVWLK